MPPRTLEPTRCPADMVRFASGRVTVCLLTYRGGILEFKQTILFVEVELLLQAELVEPLKAAGFGVLTETKGKAAIDFFNQNPSEISALITEVSLADKITGWEVAHKAREINPQLPVIYTKSCNSEVWAANDVPNSVLIINPFVAVEILTALLQLLNTSNPPGS